MSHGGATGFTPPNNIEFHYIDRDSSLGAMLLAGELDGSLLYLAGGNLVDRSSADISRDGRFRRLFPDPIQEGVSYYERTGLYPINHGFVVKREVCEAHPWVVLNIFNAFSKARDTWQAGAQDYMAPFVATGALSAHGKGSQTELFSYGVRSNETILFGHRSVQLRARVNAKACSA